MFKVAVYIRVSTNKEEQKLSLQNQQELFVNYISSKGWSVYKFYVDVDSGTKGKRPELQNLIKLKIKSLISLLVKSLVV